MTATVTQNFWAWEFTSNEWKKNEPVVTSTAVKQRSCVLEYVSNKPKDNKGVVAAAVKQDGRALKDASNRMQGRSETRIYH